MNVALQTITTESCLNCTDNTGTVSGVTAITSGVCGCSYVIYLHMAFVIINWIITYVFGGLLYVKGSRKSTVKIGLSIDDVKDGFFIRTIFASYLSVCTVFARGEAVLVSVLAFTCGVLVPPAVKVYIKNFILIESILHKLQSQQYHNIYIYIYILVLFWYR